MSAPNRQYTATARRFTPKIPEARRRDSPQQTRTTCGGEWNGNAKTHLGHVLKHAACAAVLAAEEDADERLCLVQARFDRVDVALRRAAFT